MYFQDNEACRCEVTDCRLGAGLREVPALCPAARQGRVRPLLSISAFTRSDANGGSRGEAMPERENLKQRVSESRAKRVWALPSGSCFDRRSNIVKREQKMTDSFGHSNNFATLSCANRQSHLIKIRGRPRVNIRLFLERTKGGRSVFCPPCSGGQAAMNLQTFYNLCARPKVACKARTRLTIKKGALRLPGGSPSGRRGWNIFKA